MIISDIIVNFKEVVCYAVCPVFVPLFCQNRGKHQINGPNHGACHTGKAVLGMSQRPCKVYRNFLKSNSFYQHPFRVIGVIRDSDSKNCSTNFPVCATNRKLKVCDTKDLPYIVQLQRQLHIFVQKLVE